MHSLAVAPADDDAGHPSADAKFVFHVPQERFVYRTNGEWLVREMVGREGIINHLIVQGVPNEEAERQIKRRDFVSVYGIDRAPGQPPLFIHPDRRELFVNSWVRPDIVPKAGPYPTLTRVFDWLTKKDPEGLRWLKHWMAYKIQQPDAVPKVAVVLATQQGGGKGTLALAMRYMLGFANTEVVNQSNVSSRNNSRWTDKLFVLADEVLTSENIRDISNQLKVLIDGNEIEVEDKYVKQFTAKNRLAWMFASNDSVAPVVLEKGDRRYTVFVNHEPIPPDYMAELNAAFLPDRKTVTEAFRSEIAALYHELLATPVDLAFVQRPFGNEDRSALIEASMAPHQLFIESLVAGEVDSMVEHFVESSDWTVGKSRKEWDWGEDGLSTQILYAVYAQYCRRFGGRALKINRFGAALANHRPAIPRVRKFVATLGRQINGYQVLRRKGQNAPRPD